jgi:hypothetical protein
MTKEQIDVIRGLRDEGYAIAIFSPEELEDAPANKVEDDMISGGWDSIKVLKEIYE